MTTPKLALRYTVPKGGDRKKLLELSEKNVNYFREELKKKKMLNLEDKTDNEKMKVLEQITGRSSSDRNYHYILNVLIIPISREVFLFQQWFVLRTDNPVKTITGNLM